MPSPLLFDLHQTPLVVKRILQISLGFTVLCFIANCFLTPFFGITVDYWVGLTPNFIFSGWIWQPLTSLFYYPLYPLQLGSILDCLFSSLVIWFLGKAIWIRGNNKSFLTIFLGSGIFAGVIASIAMLFARPQICYTTTYGIIGLLTTWTMLYPEEELLFFFIARLSSRWILALTLLLNFLSALSELNLVKIIALVSSFAFSYLYSLFCLNLRAPFSHLYKLDFALKNTFLFFSKIWNWHIKNQFFYRLKLKKEQEDVFMDAMLEKISKQGSNSLSWWESQKMKWISFKRRWQLKNKVK